MKVLVTGGAGFIGRWVVRELIRRGYAVTPAGLPGPDKVEGIPYTGFDCTDFESVRKVVCEHQAVIHLAAIPGPRRELSCQIFRTNCLGTYHIYEACAQAGIKKLAVASSINALGQLYGVKPLPVRYFPIDEAHPQLCSDSYSFSKKVTEEIGEFHWHRYGITSVSIRLPFVIEPTLQNAEYLRRLRREDPTNRIIVWGSYWTLIDIRDSARAFVLGIEAPYEGSHVLFVNDGVNCLGLPSRELAARCFPEVTDWREPVVADEALVSCSRAKALLGWEPQYCWGGVAQGAPPPGGKDI